MKENELRVENLVWACGDAAKIVTIDEGFCKVQFLVDIESRPIISVIDLGDIEPIPLTEEWLKDFGVFAANGTFAFDFEPAGKIIRTSIKYVHQLQNLYFDLTGEELTLTDKPQGLSAQVKQRRT